MKPLIGFVLAIALGIPSFIPAIAAFQVKPADQDRKEQEKISKVRALLNSTEIDTGDFEKEMPLAMFLAALRARLPEGKRFPLRIDEVGFGKQFPLVASAMVRMPLEPEKMSLAVTLRWICSRLLGKIEVDYAVRPDGVLLTRPRLAAYSLSYDVRTAVKLLPRSLKAVKALQEEASRDLDPGDGPGLLVRLLVNEAELRPWETLQVVNDSRLIVYASPLGHEHIADTLAWVSRLDDLHVYMNARLYEVDRDLFRKDVAPLFAADLVSRERPTVVPIGAALLKTVTRQKLLLEGEEVKLRPDRKSTFLSLRTTFRFAAGPGPRSWRGPVVGTGLAGVSFEVCPVISPDRRFLRLHLTQHTAQLAGIAKSKRLDLDTGKEIEVESPNVRKTTVAGTVQIPDGGALLMPVEYRPADPGDAGKVWLLLSRPVIWIEEEVEEYRARGEAWTPKSVWDTELPKEEKEKAPAPPPLPLTNEAKEVLQAVLTDVLTNPELKDTRAFYGTARDKTLILSEAGKWGWPRGFQPNTHGYRLTQAKPEPFAERRRVLGICLDKFDLKQKKTESLDAPVVISIFNAGGSDNGGVIGACSVYYLPKRVGKRWTVELREILDP